MAEVLGRLGAERVMVVHAEDGRQAEDQGQECQIAPNSGPTVHNNAFKRAAHCSRCWILRPVLQKVTPSSYGASKPRKR